MIDTETNSKLPDKVVKTDIIAALVNEVVNYSGKELAAFLKRNKRSKQVAVSVCDKHIVFGNRGKDKIYMGQMPMPDFKQIKQDAVTYILRDYFNNLPANQLMGVIDSTADTYLNDFEIKQMLRYIISDLFFDTQQYGTGYADAHFLAKRHFIPNHMELYVDELLDNKEFLLKSPAEINELLYYNEICSYAKVSSKLETKLALLAWQCTQALMDQRFDDSIPENMIGLIWNHLIEAPDDIKPITTIRLPIVQLPVIESLAPILSRGVYAKTGFNENVHLVFRSPSDLVWLTTFLEQGYSRQYRIYPDKGLQEIINAHVAFDYSAEVLAAAREWFDFVKYRTPEMDNLNNAHDVLAQIFTECQ